MTVVATERRVIAVSDDGLVEAVLGAWLELMRR